MMADVSTNTHTQAPRHSSASTVATMLADADLAITHDDDLSFGVQGVKRNAQAQPLASSPNVDPQLIKALESKDRIYMLKLAEQMESLINGKRSRIDLTPTTPSQRLLVHQCSAYYKLTAETDPATKNCFVQLTPDSRIPERRMSELVSPEPVSQPALNVLRRSQGDRRYKTYSRAASVAGDLADVKHSLARSLGFGGRSSTPGSSKKPMSIQEREAAYNEARSRIFMGFEEKEKEKAKEKDMSASASSLSLTYPPASNASGDSLGDLDGSITSPVTDSEWSDPSGQHSRDRKDHNRRGNASASSSTRSMRSGYHGDHSNPSSRNSRAPSPSFKYAPLYEPAPSQQLYDPNQPPNQTNAPYGTQYYHLFAPAPQGYAPPYNAGWYPPPGYPTPHNPHHPPPDPSRPIEHYPSPQMGYPHMWHPPNQPPPIQTSPLGQPGPMQHHQTHAHPAASPPPQPPAQYPYGQPPGQYPYGAPAGFGRPTPGYYPPTPPQGQPPMAQPSHPSAQMAIPGHLYDGSPAPHHGPPQPPGPQPNSGHGNKGRNNAAIARNPWSYGPGIGNGPRLTSARRQSNLSGGSSRASSYSDDGLSTSSSSTTTSSSSRRTYTTTASSQHPLPPRPDWAVGLKAQPTLARGSHEHNSPRNPMSPARGMSGDGRHPPPVLQPTDFPPLSSGPSPEKRHPVPSGAWGNSGNRAILVPPPSSAGGAVDGERNLSNPSPKVKFQSWRARL
ncbi:hypothetical protein BKA70DRAFT_472991 [Coprinopsis sp. MPI-PUGE-AT-0042]|nr:hypothetical protein BKA70DRAFT_472991 [Coprinopsis sp. MPI-PUGE-AT-0042]